jgi:hypothetical protein
VGPNPKTLGGGIPVGKGRPQDDIPQTVLACEIRHWNWSLGAGLIVKATEGKTGEGKNGPDDHPPILGEGKGHHRLQEGDIDQARFVSDLTVPPLEVALNAQEPQIRQGVIDFFG